ncbi:MAG: sulfite exporter TauE/SafE family protein [Chlamydiota bacterium]
MTLLLTMLPIYLFGNLHCIGMCGPLVMMIGQHRYRYAYFVGRLLSFALAGAMAGGLGTVIAVILKAYQVPAIASFIFGVGIMLVGLSHLMKWKFPGSFWFAQKVSPISQRLSLLLLKDTLWTTFLFGFFTVSLPCGQTIIVFSACALYGGAITGFINGFAFALLTSPSLFLAMKASHLLQHAKKHYNTVIGLCGVIVGALALCRGMAELEMIPHWILNPQWSPEYHLVVF